MARCWIAPWCSMAATWGMPTSTTTRTFRSSLRAAGFRHGQHLAFNQHNNRPLANLYLSMLHNMGLETDRFASSTGTLTGLV